MQGELDTALFADVQGPVDHRGRGAPVLVDLEAADTGVHLCVELVLVHRAALAEQADVDGELIQRLEEPPDVPCARCDGGGRTALGRSRAAADEGGHARGQSLVDLLGADEVDMGVHAARGEDPPVAGDDLGARPDHETHRRHRNRNRLPFVVRSGISNLLLGIGSIVSGLYALPMAAILPSRMPMSALTTPHQSRVSAPVMTVSTGLWSVASPLLFLPSLARCDIPIDSRITLPPPKSISLPLYEGPPLQSASISNVRSVSASRTRSRVVGPYSAV